MRILQTAPPAAAALSDLRDGDRVDAAALVLEASVRATRRGAPFISARLGDRGASVAAVMWDAPEDALDGISHGTPVRVTGGYAVHPRYGPQITIETLQALEPEEVRWEELLPESPCDAVALNRELDDVLESIADPDLAWLLQELLGACTPTGAQFRVAPAAKYNHHAYRFGLLEHSVWVARAIAAVADSTPWIDRDLAVCGALLHDIGKLEAYDAQGPLADLSDLGRLQGEIALGYFLIRRQIETRPGFPEALADGLLHIVLSHHGRLEHGSPVLPATREALLVHAMDRLSGELGSFDRLAAEAGGEPGWSRYDPALGRAVFVCPSAETGLLR
jgi:3'-5' exoribonuclease